MQKILNLAGNAMVGFLDITMGAFITALVLSCFGIPVALWHLALGALLAVLPDFDIVVAVLARGAPEENHRESLLHRPIFMISLIVVGAFELGDEHWGWCAFLCMLWHYIHDTKPLSDGGIAWLWPFSSKYVSFYGLEEPPTLNGAEASMTHRVWLREKWLRPSILSRTEISVGSVVLAAALLIATGNVVLAVVAWMIPLFGSMLVWAFSHSYVEA